MIERCPSPAEVERVYWAAQRATVATRDAELHAHALACEACRAEWSQIAELVQLGDAIPPPRFARREEIRTTLLSRVDKLAPAPHPSVLDAWRRWWFAPAACAAALLVWWLATTAEPEARAQILAHTGARSLVVSGPPHEVIRLVDGTLTITAPAQLRVITGDDEVATAGAAFDVTAARDRLVAVRVIHGNVRVAANGGTTTLATGDTWRAMLAVAPSAPPPVASPPAARRPPQPPAEPARPEPAPAVDDTPPSPDTPQPVPPRGLAQQAFDDGWAALRVGAYARAAAAFDRAIAVAGKQDIVEDATFWRAVALARDGQVIAAAHVLEAFLRAFPRAARAGEAHVMLGWLLFERGDHTTARPHFEAAVGDSSSRVRASARDGLAAIAKRTH
jgi:hypothetical protein